MTWIPSWPNTSNIPAEGRSPALAGDTCLRRADFPGFHIDGNAVSQDLTELGM
jgi:hypothetical protein